MAQETNSAAATPAQTSGSEGSAASSGASGPSATETITQQLDREAGEREAVRAFDPFGPAKEPEAIETTPKTTPEKTQQLTADGKGAKAEPDKTPAAVAAPPAKTQAEGTTPSPDPSADLQKIIQQQAEAIARLSEKPISSETAGGAPSKEPQAEGPKFNLGVPDQIMNLIGSEDPKERSLGIHTIVNGVANAVWNEAQKAIQAMEQKLVEGFPQVVERHTTLQRQQENVNRDFYGTYDVFHSKEFVPLVQSIGVQVGQEWVAAGKPAVWSAEMRDAIAGRLFAMFPALKVQHDAAKAAGAAGAANGGTTPKKQPFSTGGGSRQDPPQKNEFAELLIT